MQGQPQTLTQRHQAAAALARGLHWEQYCIDAAQVSPIIAAQQAEGSSATALAAGFVLQPLLRQMPPAPRQAVHGGKEQPDLKRSGRLPRLR